MDLLHHSTTGAQGTDTTTNSNPAHHKTYAALPKASSHHDFCIWASNEGKESSVWGTATEDRPHRHLWHECLSIVSITTYIFFPKDKNQSKYEVCNPDQNQTQTRSCHRSCLGAVRGLDVPKPLL